MEKCDGDGGGETAPQPGLLYCVERHLKQVGPLFWAQNGDL